MSFFLCNPRWLQLVHLVQTFTFPTWSFYLCYINNVLLSKKLAVAWFMQVVGPLLYSKIKENITHVRHSKIFPAYRVLSIPGRDYSSDTVARFLLLSLLKFFGSILNSMAISEDRRCVVSVIMTLCMNRPLVKNAQRFYYLCKTNVQWFWEVCPKVPALSVCGSCSLDQGQRSDKSECARDSTVHEVKTVDVGRRGHTRHKPRLVF